MWNQHDNGAMRPSPLARTFGSLGTVIGIALAMAAGPALFNFTELVVTPLLVELYGQNWGRVVRGLYWVLCFIAAALAIRASVLLIWGLVALTGATWGPRLLPLVGA